MLHAGSDCFLFERTAKRYIADDHQRGVLDGCEGADRQAVMLRLHESPHSEQEAV